jgi:hypothetical protein
MLHNSLRPKQTYQLRYLESQASLKEEESNRNSSNVLDTKIAFDEIAYKTKSLWVALANKGESADYS